MSKRIVRAGGGLNAHHLVAKTAIGLAEEWWEVYARDNALYRKMRAEGRVTERAARRVFVERVAPKLLEDARQALTKMLTQPDVCESTKEQIYEALCLDSDLRANRMVAEDQATVPAHLH